MLSRKFGIVGLLKCCGWFLAPFFDHQVWGRQVFIMNIEGVVESG